MSRGQPEFGALLPEVRVRPPGPASRALGARLRAVESRNITHVTESWPIFWEEASGSNVRDADGNVFIDLTGAFGVALLGHSSPVVRFSIGEQSRRLIHGMGDVHPPTKKLELLERLSAISPWDETRTVLATTGSEAIEIALKTAGLASGRDGILAFEGGYHGLTLGSLAATEREHFRSPFAGRVYRGVAFAPFPDRLHDGEPDGKASLARVGELLERGAPNGDAIGTLLIEPVQARGGARIAPRPFMEELSRLAAEQGVLVIADEIMTGLGRCGSMFASSRVGLTPDVICLGKALGGGLPISACMAPRHVMDAWPPSDGEAVHTSTFLGHPLSCAAALSVLDTFDLDAVAAKADQLGVALLHGLRDRVSHLSNVGDVRGLGLLLGIELVEEDGVTPAAGAAVRVAEEAMEKGVLVLPAAARGHVVELTPSITLTKEQTEYVIDVLAEAIEGVS